jgi:serine/threonine protein kinase
MIAEIIKQVLSTMIYLHSKSLYYRNLAPDDILLADGQNLKEGLNIKLVNLVV